MSASASKSMILTLSKNGSLGETSTMTWTVKEDKRWFRSVTEDVGTIVMGRKTFETMNRKPLPNRLNYILTHDPSKIEKSDIVIPITLDAFRTLNLKSYCVIGGYEIYHELLKDVTVIYVSHHKNVEVVGRVLNLDMKNCVLFDRNESEDLIKEVWIQHPYKSDNLSYAYDESLWLDKAKEVMKEESLDKGWPVGLVYVKDEKIVSAGANGSTYHDDHICERKRLNIPTGQGYELCEGCHPKNHAEAKGVNNAKKNNVVEDLRGATGYMYGHWWACKDCTEAMLNAGVIKVVMSKNWTQQYFKIANL